MYNSSRHGKDNKSGLRMGWSTGACATAATKAALELLLTGRTSNPVTITLPKGKKSDFSLVFDEAGEGWARTGVLKDAGDDPDVTHGALIISTVRPSFTGSGLIFKAGYGVGIITKAGLPLSVGEPAINPVPREMIAQSILEISRSLDIVCNDLEVEISVPNGVLLAQKTWNPRLGIIGGISILGTTGIVKPFSCEAWIHSIHRGIDVARANGLTRIAATTGSTSERAVKNYFDLPYIALIDMGDFIGGTLKYLRKNPVSNVVIAGGFAKMCKLAQGCLNLHSDSSQVDFLLLSKRVASLGAPETVTAAVAKSKTASNALEICDCAGISLSSDIAMSAQKSAKDILDFPDINLDVMVVNRAGEIISYTNTV
ncbi:MAG: Cobalt-precorrin-5B C(1)-methyltransferase [Hyphomicrobiaceae bacterium hypho_1]